MDCKDEDMRDTVIRLDVLEELNLGGCMAVPGIGVSVRRGHVTLVGSVPTTELLAVAEHAALKVRGVLDVSNELRVRPSGRCRDNDLAQRATALIEPTWGPFKALDMTVEDGWILLTGQVGSEATKAGLRKILGVLPGVVGVVNLLDVVASRRDAGADLTDA